MFQGNGHFSFSTGVINRNNELWYGGVDDGHNDDQTPVQGDAFSPCRDQLHERRNFAQHCRTDPN
jgi:hypothetical protein